jgi:hypothetical protein
MTAAQDTAGEGRRAVRRASACPTLLVLACLAFSATASAAPTVTLKVAAIPIPGFPGTGDTLGAGAEVEARVTISGTEYGGFPSPLTKATFYAPVGVKVSPTGFAYCPPAALEASGATGCPKNSRAGPRGEGLGVVSFANERVNERVSIQPFFAPAGGLIFYVEGNTPASFQILEEAHWMTASAPFGPELLVEVPLVETVPGANDASILSFRVKVGAAYTSGGAKKTISYLTLPKSCPRGGFPVKAELQFMSGEIVTVAYKQPCPSHRAGAFA